ncbi:hypothetical protein DL95DRAFT_410682 [Leptodontidium sp. 2 PMI_412]|nr:hypothetical protein DL95DRAFT_410682 [Leptodontidium sp. 2 PMI_412]
MSEPQTKQQKQHVVMNNIPSVKELCALLGFQNAHNPGKNADRFQEVASEFVKSHQLPPGMALEDLLKWNDVTVQWELKSMAQSFLSEGDYGNLFWGGKGVLQEDGLNYPEDSDRIVSLLMQVFWKQNRDTFDDLQRVHGTQSELREHTTQFSENIQRQRPASRSSAMRRETPDSQTNILNRKSMPIPKPSPAGASRTTVIPDVFDGPDDVDVNIRNVFDFFSKDGQADVQSHPTLRPETPSSAVINTCKRKAQGDLRRSVRKRVPVQRPDYFLDGDDVDERLHETSSSDYDNGPLKESIERDEEFERDSCLDIGQSSNQNSNTSIPAASPSGGNPFKAPAAPMVSAPAKTKTPVSKSKVSKPSPSSSKALEKVKSVSNDAPPTRKRAAAAGQKILKLNVPSIKAQSKPLGKKPSAAPHPKTSLNQATEISSGSPMASSGTGGNALPALLPTATPPPPSTTTQHPLPSLATQQHPEVSLPEFATVVPTPTSTPRPKPQVPLWVITHTPRYTEELWDTGRLSGHSLSTFLNSLSSLTSHPVESIDKIKLTLRTPVSDTKIAVGREAEESWGAAMKVFRERLRRMKGVVEGCLIFIEPVWEVEGGEEGVGGGEEDVDF